MSVIKATTEERRKTLPPKNSPPPPAPLLGELCFQISHFLLTATLPEVNIWKQSRFLDRAHGMVAAVGSKLGIKMTSSSKEPDNPEGEI